MIALRGKNGYIVEVNVISIQLVIDGGSLLYPIATLLRVCNFSELDFHHFISSCHKSLLFQEIKFRQGDLADTKCISSAFFLFIKKL